jgi:hypothetical protein
MDRMQFSYSIAEITIDQLITTQTSFFVSFEDDESSVLASQKHEANHTHEGHHLMYPESVINS